MTLAAKYNELMDKITVTDDMRRRILQGLDEADYGQRAERRGPVYFTRWKESAALAACVALLFAGVLAMPTILNRQSPPLQMQPNSASSQPHSESRRQYPARSSEAVENEEAEASSKVSSPQAAISIKSPSEANSSSAQPRAASSESSAAAGPQRPQSSSSASVSDTPSAPASSFSMSGALPPLGLGGTVSQSEWAQAWGGPASGAESRAQSAASASKPSAAESAAAGTRWFATPDAVPDTFDTAEDPMLAKGGTELEEGDTQYSSRSELAAATGFEVEGVSRLPFAVTGAEYLAAESGRLAQINYTTASGKTACWRKAAGAKDLSGASSKDMDTESFAYEGMRVTLIGKDDGYSAAWWTDGAYSWSLVLQQSLSKEDWELLMEYCS